MAELKIKADSGGGTVSFKGPATTTSNAAVQLTLPVDDGTANQYLKTDGSGALSWGTIAAQTEQDASTGDYTLTDGDFKFATDVKGIKFNGNSSTGYIVADTTSSHQIQFNVGGNLNSYAWKFGGTEKMRWHSNSSFRWGDTLSNTTNYDSTMGFFLAGAADGSRDMVVGTCAISAAGVPLILNRSNTSNGDMTYFRKGGSTKGSISMDSVSVSYNTSSDYRLKQDEVAISDGITRLKTLKPYRFKWKADTSKFVDGFFAHEVTPAVPEAVKGEKDATPGDFGSGYQQIDQSKLVPLLTAALQEAIAEIETLKTKVAALEAG